MAAPEQRRWRVFKAEASGPAPWEVQACWTSDDFEWPHHFGGGYQDLYRLGRSDSCVEAIHGGSYATQAEAFAAALEGVAAEARHHAHIGTCENLHRE